MKRVYTLLDFELAHSALCGTDPPDLCAIWSLCVDRVHSAICICVDRDRRGGPAHSLMTGPIQIGTGPLSVERVDLTFEERAKPQGEAYPV